MIDTRVLIVKSQNFNLIKNYFSVLTFLLKLLNNKVKFDILFFKYTLFTQSLLIPLSLVNLYQTHSNPNRYLPLSPDKRVELSITGSEANFQNSKSAFFINKFTFVKKTLINLFFFFNYSYFGSQFSFKSHYNLFAVRDSKTSLVVFDLNKFFARWNDSYNLIFNTYYYNLNPILLGSALFKNEILALNWNYSYFDINLWRYYFPFFIFRSNKFSTKSSFFFDRLNLFEVNSFIATDCHYHYKNLHYLKKKKFYTIGLVDIHTSPWIVDYPILSFFESFISQSFFFKFLIFTERQVLFIKYSFFKNYWYVVKSKSHFLFNNF